DLRLRDAGSGAFDVGSGGFNVGFLSRNSVVNGERPSCFSALFEDLAQGRLSFRCIRRRRQGMNASVVDIYKPGQAPLRLDLHEPFAVLFAAQFGYHLLEVSEFRAEATVKYFGFDSRGQGPRGLVSAAIDRNQAALLFASSSKLGYQGRPAILSGAVCYRRNLSSANDHSIVGIAQRYLDYAREAAEAQIVQQRINQHIAGCEVSVNWGYPWGEHKLIPPINDFLIAGP